MVSLSVKDCRGNDVELKSIDSRYNTGTDVSQVNGSSVVSALQKAMKENQEQGKKPFEDIDFPKCSQNENSKIRNMHFFNEVRSANPELFDKFVQSKSRDTASLDNVVELLHQVRLEGSATDRKASGNMMEEMDSRVGDFSSQKLSSISVNSIIKLGMASENGFGLVNYEFARDVDKNDTSKCVINQNLMNSEGYKKFKGNMGSSTRDFLDKQETFSNETYAKKQARVSALRDKLSKREDGAPVGPKKSVNISKIDVVKLKQFQLKQND